MSQSNQPATTAEFDEFYAPVSTGGGAKAPTLEAGNYIGRCVSMALLGTFDDEYQGQKKKVEKIRLSFELPTEMHVYTEEKGEEPRLISKEYTFSMGEKANMRKDLESWRGQKFTDDEARAFNVAKLLGVPCMVNIIQKTSKTGNTYAQINTLTPIPKGFQVPAQITPSTTFSVKTFNQAKFDALPEFLQKEIQKSDEYKAMGLPAPVAQAQQAPPAQPQPAKPAYVPGQGVLPPAPPVQAPPAPQQVAWNDDNPPF